MIDGGKSGPAGHDSRRARTPGLVRVGFGLMALLSLSVFPARAEADDESADPFDRPGPYVTLAGSYAYNFFDQEIEDYLEDELGEQGSVDIDDSGGINARIGYRAASWFAAELDYEWIDRYDVEIGGDLGPGGSALSGRLYDIEGHTLTVNTRFIAPIWRIQPYLLLGAGVSVYDVDRGPVAAALEAQDDDIEIEDGRRAAFAGRVGLGIDLHLTEHIVLQTEGTALITAQDFDTPDEGAIDDLYYLSISAGLQYRF
jgi:opacity protein-like surface antigen